MIFQVEMDVKVPHNIESSLLENLKASEKTRSQELQSAGIWRHLWRVVGQYKNISIFEVPTSAELHDILSTLPLFPFMEIRVTALCRHPSSIHDDDS